MNFIKKVENQDVKDKKLDEIKALIKGKTGQTRTITIIRDNKPIDIELKLENIESRRTA